MIYYKKKNGRIASFHTVHYHVDPYENINAYFCDLNPVNKVDSASFQIHACLKRFKKYQQETSRFEMYQQETSRT